MSEENIYAAPQSTEVTHRDEGEHKPLTLKQKLWGFEGRISRAGYWGYSYSWGLLIGLPFLIPYLILIFSLASTAETGATPNIPLTIILAVLCILFAIPSTWVSFALMAKRFHDRGKSGWWSLICLVPYVGGIWVLIDCGCIAGDKGRNAYGDDPLLADGKTHDN